MADVMNIGRGGLLAYRMALAVTGENIANVDTPNYNRRTAMLQETTPGTGVDVVEIRRAFDTLLADRSRTAEGRLGSAETYLTHLRALENRLLPGDGGLPDVLDTFFDALDGLALAPGDQGLRHATIGAGQSLAMAVSDLARGLQTLEGGVSAEADQAAAQVTSLLTGLADTQRKLGLTSDDMARTLLLDQRDGLLSSLAELVDIEIEIGADDMAQVRLGSDGAGPIVLDRASAGRVSATSARELTVVQADPDAPAVKMAAGSGVLSGLADAQGAVAQAQRDLDGWAGKLTAEMNALHGVGLTAAGNTGGPLFSMTGWTATPGALMRGDAVAQITAGLPDAMPGGPITLVYDATAGLWDARDADGQVLAQGTNGLSLPDLRVSISGTPLDGDRIVLTRRDDAAINMSFVPKTPQDLATAAALTASASAQNLGAATLTARATPQTVTGLPDLADLLSAGPVEFVSPGIVGVIPAGATGADLSVQPRLAAMDLTPPNGAVPLTLTVTTGSGVQNFDLSGLPDLRSAVTALNAGDILTPGGESLGDLGLLALDNAPTLTLMARGGNLPGNASLVTDLGSATGVVVADAAPAADLAVFTSDGRQLSGVPLSPAQAAALLTPQNGFDPQAVYSTEYLNGAAPFGAVGLDRQSAAGDYALTLGKGSGLATWIGPQAGPERAGAQIGFDGADQSIDLQLPDGANASWIAETLTEALPVTARAETRVALDLPASGNLSLRLAGQNLTPISISADLGAGGPGALHSAINAQTVLTGIRAELSPNGDRLILVQPDGADIGLASVAMTGPDPITLTRLSPDGMALDSVTLGTGPETAARISGTVTLTGAVPFALSEDGGVITAQTDGFENGVIRRTSSAAGSAITLTPADPLAGDLTPRQISITGSDGRVHTAEADPMVGSGPALARALAADLRETAPASRITGAPLAALPPEGAVMRVALGEQVYAVRMSNGTPVVSGPEEGRITAGFDAQNRLVLETMGGDLDGNALRLPPDAADAARFGMGVGDGPMTAVIGQPFDAGNLPSSFTVSIGGVSHTVSVTASNVVLPATFPGTGYINTAYGRVEIHFDARAEGFGIPAQSGAADAGFDTLGLSASVSGGSLALTATDDRVLDLRSVTPEAGETLRLSSLPDEDLLVMLTGPGALRLSGEMANGPAPQQDSEVRVLNAEAGLVGLFDRATGAHLASRLLDPSGRAQFGGIEVMLTGTPQTGDRFGITANTAAPGDGRTIEALANLRQQDSLTGQGGYATGFASIQQRVGAQVSAAENRTTIATVERDSAERAVADLSGVNLDEEAANLMQQQQAYQANAQVMSVARALFDTLLQAI
ncbi:MAG: flagellar basal body rod C-terminal domain-containing protein [Pelagibaca sp.]